MKRSIVIAGPVLVLAAGLFYATAISGGQDAFAYRDPQVVARGQALYVEYCASCHGAALEGQQDWRERDSEGYLPAPPHDETGHTWHHPDAQLYEITKLGTEAVVGGGYRSRMIGFGDTLDDTDIRAILAFIKSTWPRQIIERHDELNAAYEAAN